MDSREIRTKLLPLRKLLPRLPLAKGQRGYEPVRGIPSVIYSHFAV